MPRLTTKPKATTFDEKGIVAELNQAESTIRLLSTGIAAMLDARNRNSWDAPPQADQLLILDPYWEELQQAARKSQELNRKLFEEHIRRPRRPRKMKTRRRVKTV